MHLQALFSLHSQIAYAWASAQPSLDGYTVVIKWWWWIPPLMALTYLFFIIFLNCYIWFMKLRGRVLDIETGILLDDDDHQQAAAPTLRMTEEELEEAFPSFAHGKIMEMDEDECAICLEEFKEGDECRMLLPSCFHIFHKACVDPWLFKDGSCPLCRAVLFSYEHM